MACHRPSTVHTRYHFLENEHYRVDAERINNGSMIKEEPKASFKKHTGCIFLDFSPMHAADLSIGEYPQGATARTYPRGRRKSAILELQKLGQ